MRLTKPASGQSTVVPILYCCPKAILNQDKTSVDFAIDSQPDNQASERGTPYVQHMICYHIIRVFFLYLKGLYLRLDWGQGGTGEKPTTSVSQDKNKLNLAPEQYRML
jgi:hypothetical protein